MKHLHHYALVLLIGLSGCVSYDDGSIALSTPASSQRVKAGEEALARELEQRLQGDADLTDALGDVRESVQLALASTDDRIRADMSAAFESYGTDPDGVVAQLGARMAEASQRNANALANVREEQAATLERFEATADEQRTELSTLIDRLQAAGESDDTLLWVLLGTLGLGGATLGGRQWGRVSNRNHGAGGDPTRQPSSS